jgi:hypothetical protein
MSSSACWELSPSPTRATSGYSRWVTSPTCATSIGFSIVTPDRNIRKIFEITGLDRVLTIHQTRAVAMNGGLRIA